MAQTFRDFIVECELYPYSKENFEIMKECTELKLQEKYLENARYMEAVADIYTEANGYHLAEGYFQEAADTSFLEAVEDEANKKKVGILGKIIKGIQWLIGKLAKFFNFIGSKLDKLAGNTEAVATKVEAIDISPANIEAVKDALRLKGSNLADNVKTTGDFYIDFAKLHMTGIGSDVASYVKYYLAILFGKNQIRVVPNDSDGPLALNNYVDDESGIIDIKTLDEIIKVVTKWDLNAADLQSVIKRFDTSLNIVKKTGVDITLSSKKIAEFQANLVNQYKPNMDKLVKNINDAIANTKSFDELFPGFSRDMGVDNMQLMSDFISKKLIKSIGYSIKFYGDLVNYRNEALRSMNDLAGKTTEQPEEKKAEEKPAEPTKEENK